MVVKKLLINKKDKYKKSTLNKGQFFSDQNLLKNQITIYDLQQEKDKESQDKDKLGQANQEVSQQNTKKKKITNLLMFIFNILIVVAILVYQLTTSKVEPFKNIIKSGLFRWQYVLAIAGCFVLIMLLETIRPAFLLKQSTKKYHFSLCYKTMAIGRYWDCITPMSTGGQPFQVFYLNKHGIPSVNEIYFTLAIYVIFQISWLIISIFAMVYSTKNFGKGNLVSVASYIGFFLNAVMLVGIWVLSISRRLGKILVAKTLKLLKKMHIIKNYEKAYDKVMNTVNGFQTTMKMYTKNIFSFILMVLSNLLQHAVNYIMPFLIYLMLGGAPDFTMAVTIFVYSILIDLAAGFIPLPGGTGMSELSFTIVFKDIFPNGTVFWGLLLWRFMSYYIYLIQGLILIIYDYVIGNKKYEWEKKKLELEDESNKFKDIQIKNYNKRKRTGKIKL